MDKPTEKDGIGPAELRILDELQKDCRLSNQELAERVNLSPSACWRRVRALEESGVIQGYVAKVDPERVGLTDCVFANVRLGRHLKANTEDFVAAVMSRPEVLDCYATTGDEDYMLRVLAPSVRDYDRFLQDFLLDLPYVDHVRSHFVLRRIKAETRIPPEIFPQRKAP